MPYSKDSHRRAIEHNLDADALGEYPIRYGAKPILRWAGGKSWLVFYERLRTDLLLKGVNLPPRPRRRGIG